MIRKYVSLRHLNTSNIIIWTRKKKQQTKVYLSVSQSISSCGPYKLEKLMADHKKLWIFCNSSIKRGYYMHTHFGLFKCALWTSCKSLISPRTKHWSTALSKFRWLKYRTKNLPLLSVNDELEGKLLSYTL